MLENELKNLIIKKYGSLKKFSEKINLPYTTVHTIFIRGLKNSNIKNVIKICEHLNIDVNELENNKIVYKRKDDMLTKITSKDFINEVIPLIDRIDNLNEKEKNRLKSDIIYICED